MLPDRRSPRPWAEGRPPLRPRRQKCYPCPRTPVTHVPGLYRRGDGGEGRLRTAMRFDQLISRELRERMVQVAREFRQEPTESEALLWSALRNRKLDGHRFRRQQPIGPFVVGFYCDEAALVVEVDGPYT